MIKLLAILENNWRRSENKTTSEASNSLKMNKEFEFDREYAPTSFKLKELLEI